MFADCCVICRIFELLSWIPLSWKHLYWFFVNVYLLPMPISYNMAFIMTYTNHSLLYHSKNTYFDSITFKFSMRAFRNLIWLQIQRIFSNDWGERHVETWLALKWKENGHEGVIYLLDRILKLQQYIKIANFLILFANIQRKLKS